MSYHHIYNHLAAYTIQKANEPNHLAFIPPTEPEKRKPKNEKKTKLPYSLKGILLALFANAIPPIVCAIMIAPANHTAKSCNKIFQGKYIPLKPIKTVGNIYDESKIPAASHLAINTLGITMLVFGLREKKNR